MKVVLIILMAVASAHSREMICDEEPVDLALLIDSSSSIVTDSYQNMIEVREFAKQYLGYYDISEEGTHAAVIRYSNEAELLFNFGEYNEKVINNKIGSIEAGGNTYMDKALQMAYDDVFTEEAGMRKVEDGVKRVLVLFTDGKQTKIPPYTEPKIITDKLKKDKHVTIYTIAVGSEKDQFKALDELASKPIKDHTFQADNFADLKTVVDKVINKQCKPKPTPTPKIVPCPLPVDVALLIDSSNSMTNDDWTKMKDVAKGIAQTISIDPKYGHIAIIRFNTNPELVLSLKEGQQSNANVNNVIDSFKRYRYGRGHLPISQGSTYIDRAFELANNDIFTEKAGMRNGVKKLCILLTDGMQTDYKDAYTPPHEAVLPLKEKGVEIFTVGMGNDVDVEELANTASIPEDCYSDDTSGQLFQVIKGKTTTLCTVPA